MIFTPLTGTKLNNGFKDTNGLTAMTAGDAFVTIAISA